jgi:AcrR family transcriptional regulator
MPRAFTPDERRRAELRLLAAAREHFTRYGYRSASVERIARAARLGKGTVYLFARSKSALFRRVAEEAEEELRAELRRAVDRHFASPRERVEVFLRTQVRALEEHPLLRLLLNPAEADALLRDLPEGALEELARSDDEFFRDIVLGWERSGVVAGGSAELMGGLSRALYAVVLQRILVGEQVFPAVMELLVTSVAARLAPPPSA